MKIGKIIAALIISVILLAVNGMVFGLFAADHALSESSIHKTIKETELIESTLNEALRDNTVNMGGQYEDMLNAIMKSDAMTDFFTAYMKAAIDTEVYGKPYQEVANDELTRAFSDGIAEVSASGKFKISPLEETVMTAAMAQEIPDLTQNLNSAITHYDTTSGELVQGTLDDANELAVVMGKPMRIGLLLADAVCCILLIILFWRSRLGFLWCAVNTGLVSAGYLLIYKAGSLAAGGTGDDSLADYFLMNMAGRGFLRVAIVGFAITAAWIVLCIVFRRFRKKPQNAAVQDMPLDSGDGKTWKFEPKPLQDPEESSDWRENNDAEKSQIETER